MVVRSGARGRVSIGGEVFMATCGAMRTSKRTTAEYTTASLFLLLVVGGPVWSHLT